MRLLVVGNSHATALVSSKQKNPKNLWAGVDADFYVIPGKIAPRLVERGGRFYPERESKTLKSTIENVQAEGLDVASYDAILFSALGIPAARNQHLVSKVHPLGRAHLFHWRETEAGPQPLVSERYMLDLIRDQVATSGSYRFVKDAARLFHRPIYVQFIADPSVDVLDDQDWLLRQQLGENLEAALAEFAKLRDRAIVDLLSELPDHVIPMPQPKQMVVKPGFIKAAYARRTDWWHTNAKHGQLVLQRIQRLRATTSNASKAATAS